MTVSRPYCANWLFVGKKCDKPWGECTGWHGNFDRISIPGDKKIIADHVASTPNMWFNIANVHSLTEMAHLAQLADCNGPPVRINPFLDLFGLSDSRNLPL